MEALSRRDFLKRLGFTVAGITVITAGSRLGLFGGDEEVATAGEAIGISKVKAGRAIVDAYRKKHDATGKDFSFELQEQMEGLGFNSIEHFFECNSQTVSDDMKRCIRYVGECDLCKGRKHTCSDYCWNVRMKGGTVPLVPMMVAGGKGKFTMSYHYPNAHVDGEPIGKKTLKAVDDMLPGCSIKATYIEDPSIVWGWK